MGQNQGKEGEDDFKGETTQQQGTDKNKTGGNKPSKESNAMSQLKLTQSKKNIAETPSKNTTNSKNDKKQPEPKGSSSKLGSSLKGIVSKKQESEVKNVLGSSLKNSFSGKNTPSNNKSIDENEGNETPQQKVANPYNRRKSMIGSAMVENNVEIKKASNQVKEGDFIREIPSYLDLLDFYQNNDLPPLNLFPDMPEPYKEPFMLINLIRTQPQLFAKSYLEKYRMRYASSEGIGGTPNLFISLDKSRAIQTFEGLYALEECVQRLRKMKPVPPMMWNNDLFYASKDHIDDIGPLGLYGHQSSLGLSMFDRIRNYSEREPGMLTENILFGTLLPTEAIILMLIDDGDPSERKMRENLLDPTHRFIGFACGKHKFQSGMFVAMMCYEFLEKEYVRDMHRNVYQYDDIDTFYEENYMSMYNYK